MDEQPGSCTFVKAPTSLRRVLLCAVGLVPGRSRGPTNVPHKVKPKLKRDQLMIIYWIAIGYN